MVQQLWMDGWTTGVNMLLSLISEELAGITDKYVQGIFAAQCQELHEVAGTEGHGCVSVECIVHLC